MVLDLDLRRLSLCLENNGDGVEFDLFSWVCFDGIFAVVSCSWRPRYSALPLLVLVVLVSVEGMVVSGLPDAVLVPDAVADLQLGSDGDSLGVADCERDGDGGRFAFVAFASNSESISISV